MYQILLHHINHIRGILFVTGIMLLLSIANYANGPDGFLKAKRSRNITAGHTGSKRKYIEVLIGTYLGNEKNNYYGNKAPDRLDVIWKHFLGYGNTNLPKHKGEAAYYGAGWTGQPLIIKEKNIDYLVIGAYDHQLKKISCETGDIVWNYKYDDIIKGTGSIWINRHTRNPEEKYVILQGSRRGLHNKLTDNSIESFRGISFLTGREIWRLNVRRTHSYSRDVDGTALVIGDTVIIGLENGILTLLNPVNITLDSTSGKYFPEILSEHYLYNVDDISTHGGNLVTESTPCMLKDKVYITAGSGHIYGYDLRKDTIDWDFPIRADLNGSPVVTNDECLLVPVEKQYIKGKGGVMKLDPEKDPEQSVIWYFPTGTRKFADWSGGVIGTVAVNSGERQVAAFNAIDGYFYVVDHSTVDTLNLVEGPDNSKLYPSPNELFKYRIGPSISTPIIVNNKVITASYNGVYIFSYDDYFNFTLLKHYPGVFESTPVVHDNKIYIASRDGYLYCFGDTGNAESVIEAKKEIEMIEEPNKDMNDNAISTIVNQIKNQDKMEPVVVYLAYIKERLEMNKTLLSNNGRIFSLLCKYLKHQPEKVKSFDIGGDRKYHLITGSFTIKENAVKFCAMLKDKGFDANMFGPKGGFYFVSLVSSTTRAEAAGELPLALNEGYKDAWVMKY